MSSKKNNPPEPKIKIPDRAWKNFTVDEKNIIGRLLEQFRDILGLTKHTVIELIHIRTGIFLGGVKNAIGHLKSGVASNENANATIYWIAVEHADKIDKLEDEETHSFLKGYISDVLVIDPQQPIQMSVEPDKTEQPKDNAQPILTTEQSTNDLHYSNTLIKVLGRDKEQAQLCEFLKVDGGFRWLQLAGTGGQGKSRLAYDLVLECQHNMDWFAGFLNDYNLQKLLQFLDTWQPTKPTLIVLDYILGREISVGAMLRIMLHRSDEFLHPVRVLLLERQAWNTSENASQQYFSSISVSNPNPTVNLLKKSDWFLKICGQDQENIEFNLNSVKYKNGTIHLHNLDPDILVEVITKIAKHANPSIEMVDDNSVKKILNIIDQSGSPLIAHIVAHSIASDTFKTNWSRDELLTDQLVRTHSKRWAAKLGNRSPALLSDTQSMRLAILATMIGEVDINKLVKYPDWANLDNVAVRDAVILTDGFLGNDSVAHQKVSGLKPDLLGEWFVLYNLSGHLKNRLTSLCTLAWQLAPREFAHFHLRCSNDFFEHPVAASLLSIIPTNEEGKSYYAEVSGEIQWQMYKAHRYYRGLRYINDQENDSLPNK